MKNNLEKFLEGKSVGWFSSKGNVSYGTICYYVSELNSLEICFWRVRYDIFYLNINL